jgi:hypothetical protein
MISPALLQLADRYGELPTADDIAGWLDQGVLASYDAVYMLERLDRQRTFEAPMSDNRRALLAALTRAANYRPRLLVDNTKSNPEAQARSA